MRPRIDLAAQDLLGAADGERRRPARAASRAPWSLPARLRRARRRRSWRLPRWRATWLPRSSTAPGARRRRGAGRRRCAPTTALPRCACSPSPARPWPCRRPTGLRGSSAARSSSAAAIGGHTIFIVNQTSSRNTISWMIRVEVMLTSRPRRNGESRSGAGRRPDPGLTWAGSASWARNGFAVVYQSAIPVPMMNDASIRPSSRKTLVCSTPISSGWRAADSRYLLPMMPTPTQAPSAPRPMMRPAATATRPMSSMLTPEFW